MLIPKREDSVHKAQMYQLLVEILDNPIVSQQVYFKGGSAAAMVGWLDRFSVDLDFDLKRGANKKILDDELKKIFKNLDFTVDKKSRQTLFYLLKYKSHLSSRNSLKLSLIDIALKSNQYAPQFLSEIGRFALCQTIETMFANKLVAITDRYKKRKMIAGRDLYDVHYFFLKGHRYLPEIIVERTGKKPASYLKELKDFIDKKVNEKIITEDLNFLLPAKKFKLIKKVLKRETLMFLKDELLRLK